MLLEGETVPSAGTKAGHRIRWSVLPGGQVGQLWEQSSDVGATWSVALDGTCSRKTVPPARP